MNSLNKLNMPDLNEYDVARIMRENMNDLERKNTQIIQFITGDNGLPPDVTLDFANEVTDNAAEILYVLSATENNADLQTYLVTSPLFRSQDGGQ